MRKDNWMPVSKLCIGCKWKGCVNMCISCENRLKREDNDRWSENDE